MVSINKSTLAATNHSSHSQKIITKSAFRSWTVYALSIIVYAIVFNFWQVEVVPTYVHLAGVLVAALCLSPLAAWYATNNREIPMFPLICIAYLLAFSTPVYLQMNQVIIESQAIKYTWDGTFHTLILAAIGVGGMLLGFYTSRSLKLVPVTYCIDLPIVAQWRGIYIVLTTSCGLIFTALSTVAHIDISNNSGWAAILKLASFQSYLGIVLLTQYIYSGEVAGKWWKLLLSCSVVASALMGLLTGMLENAVAPLVLVFVMRWYMTRRLAWHWLIPAITLFMLINSTKGLYRKEVWFGQGDVNTMDRITLWVRLSQQAEQDIATGDTINNLQAMLATTTSRFDLLHTFIRVQDMTPDIIPYYNGSTYDYLLYGWIPRIIWPNKPTAQGANVTFARDYHLLGVSDMTTTTGIGLLPEAYANFGILGIFIIMTLQGFVFTILDKLLNGQYSEGGRAIYLCCMFYFLNGIGTQTATLFMGAISLIFINVLLLRFFSHGWRVPKTNRQAHKNSP